MIYYQPKSIYDGGGILEDDSCIFYSKDVETVGHVLWECLDTTDV